MRFAVICFHIAVMLGSATVSLAQGQLEAQQANARRTTQQVLIDRIWKTTDAQIAENLLWELRNTGPIEPVLSWNHEKGVPVQDFSLFHKYLRLYQHPLWGAHLGRVQTLNVPQPIVALDSGGAQLIQHRPEPEDVSLIPDKGVVQRVLNPFTQQHFNTPSSGRRYATATIEFLEALAAEPPTAPNLGLLALLITQLRSHPLDAQSAERLASKFWVFTPNGYTDPKGVHRLPFQDLVDRVRTEARTLMKERLGPQAMEEFMLGELELLMKFVERPSTSDVHRESALRDGQEIIKILTKAMRDSGDQQKILDLIFLLDSQYTAKLSNAATVSWMNAVLSAVDSLAGEKQKGSVNRRLADLLVVRAHQLPAEIVIQIITRIGKGTSAELVHSAATLVNFLNVSRSRQLSAESLSRGWNGFSDRIALLSAEVLSQFAKEKLLKGQAIELLGEEIASRDLNRILAAVKILRHVSPTELNGIRVVLEPLTNVGKPGQSDVQVKVSDRILASFVRSEVAIILRQMPESGEAGSSALGCSTTLTKSN